MTTTAVDLPDNPDDDSRAPSQRDRQGDSDQAGDRANAIRLLSLRTMGMTYDQIAQETGYADGSGARQALLRALDRHEAENAGQLRDIENMRLDASERVLRGIASSTAPVTERIRAVDALTRLSARRARMNGLDAPVQVQLSAGIAADLEDALAELEQQVTGGATVPGEVTDVHDEPPEA